MEIQTRSAADAFSWERALELAVASRFIYRQPGLAEEKLRKWGYARVETIDKENQRCLVAVSGKRLIVAFRGATDWGRWFASLPFCGQKDSNFGPVHPDFLDAFRALKGLLWAALEQLDPEAKREIWLTGHGLGGALATLAAAEYPVKERIKGIYTFGQPRVGFEEFGARFDAEFGGRMLRFIYRDDPVPRAPSATFVHAGRLAWLKGDGRVIVATEGEARYRGTEDALPEPFTEPRMIAAQADVERAVRQAASGQAAEPAEEDGNLQAVRGTALPVDSHRTENYVAAVEEQVSRLAAAQSAPPPAPAPATPAAPAPAAGKAAENLAPVNLVQLPPLRAADPNIPASAIPEPLWEQLPPLSIHVVWTPQSAASSPCAAIAQGIADCLGRSAGTGPEADAGAGIPVYAGHHFPWVLRLIDRLSVPRLLDSKLVLVLLLDEASRKDLTFRSVVDRLLKARGAGSFRSNALIVPVLVDDSWKAALPADLPGIAFGPDPEPSADKLDRIEWDLAAATARFLMQVRSGSGPVLAQPGQVRAAKVRLLVDAAPADEAHTGALMQALGSAPGERLRSFFDLPVPATGGSPAPALPESGMEAVALLVRTEAFASSASCRGTLLDAKRAGIPLISLWLANGGGVRSFPYEGNALTLCARLPLEAHTLASLAGRCAWVCLKAWLHHLHFHHAARVVERRRGAGLPAQFLSRPPELLDFVAGPLRGDGPGVVIHADPPLSARDTQVLRRAYPRIRLATPATLSRETVSRMPAPPLEGLRIAVSLSPSPDLPESLDAIPATAAATGAGGLLPQLLNGAAEDLTLSLIQAGAELAFGAESGSEAPGPRLAQLVAGHAPGGKPEAEVLHFYAPAQGTPAAAGEPVTASRIRVDAVPGIDQLPPRVQAAFRASLTRVWMAKDQQQGGSPVRSCDARLVLGGPAQPQFGAEPSRFEYSGRFPGAAEEVFRHLSEKKPVYVAAGFLGAAGQVALALCNELDKLPKEADWKRRSEEHRAFCESFDKHRPAALAGLPATLDDLWKALAEFGKGYFWGKDAAEDKLWTNGLTVADNRALFLAHQSDQIDMLVAKGLAQVVRQRQKAPGSPLKVALCHGSIADALDVDAYAVLILGSSRFRGADAELDAKTNGLLQRTLESRTGRFEEAIALRSAQLSGECVLPCWIEDLQPLVASREGGLEWLKGRVREGLTGILRRAAQQRVRSLAIVPLGANLGLDACEAVNLIVETVLAAQGDSRIDTLALCETDPERYARIRKTLDASARATPRLRVVELPGQPLPASQPPLFLHFQQKEAQRRKRPGKIAQLVRGPRSAGAVPLAEREVFWTEIAETCAGQNGAPPAFAEHERLGGWLAENVLAPGVAEAARSEGIALAWDLLTDAPCSALPFEMISVARAGGQTPVRPALLKGIRRGFLAGRQPGPAVPLTRSCYRVLLVSNPTGDLKATETSAERIRQRLTGTFGDPHALPRIEVAALSGKEASVERLLEEFSSGRYDFIHFAGHSTLDPDRPEKSGLKLAKGFLKAADLQNSLSGLSRTSRPARGKTAAAEAADDPHPPLVFLLNTTVPRKMNAVNPFGLAQTVLRSGVGGFLGNRWNVADQAMEDFAVTVCAGLVSGSALGDAICRARELLFEQKSADWCNFTFYGSPELRLA